MTRGSRSGRAAMLAAAVLLAASGAETRAADEVSQCAGAVTGVYLTTIRNSAGNFASRSLVTVRGDGTVEAVDSAQYQGVQKSGFTSQRGTYRCTGKTDAVAVTVNFSFPPYASIARSDWIFRIRENGAMAGTITLFVHDGLENVDPFATKGKLIDIYRITGVRVQPPKPPASDAPGEGPKDAPKDNPKQ